MGCGIFVEDVRGDSKRSADVLAVCAIFGARQRRARGRLQLLPDGPDVAGDGSKLDSVPNTRHPQDQGAIPVIDRVMESRKSDGGHLARRQCPCAARARRSVVRRRSFPINDAFGSLDARSSPSAASAYDPPRQHAISFS